MKKFQNIKVLTRATLVTSALIAIVGGVTFAALQSQQALLKGNTIQTATANLQLSSDGNTYTTSLSGYSFSGLIPGGQPSPLTGYPVYLKNAGNTPLSLRLSIAKAVTNPDNVDLSKVHVILTPFSGVVPQNVTLQDLVTSATTGGVALTQTSRIIASQSTGYTIQISMDSDAVTGPSASLSDIDFSFGAVATT